MGSLIIDLLFFRVYQWNNNFDCQCQELLTELRAGVWCLSIFWGHGVVMIWQLDWSSVRLVVVVTCRRRRHHRILMCFALHLMQLRHLLSLCRSVTWRTLYTRSSFSSPLPSSTMLCFCLSIGKVTDKFLPRDAMLAYYMLSSRVCLYFRLSVTTWYCTKTPKRRITQTTPYDNPETLVFRCQRSRQNFNGTLIGTRMRSIDCRYFQWP